MNSGDTAWLLVSTALVMVMLPGLALFYGGLVRRKNVLSTIMHSFFGLALVSVLWVLVGFTLAFGPDVAGLGLIGGPDFLGFANVGLEPNPAYAPTIPFVLFAAFQLMFAAITPALITGAFAERKRFRAYVIFTALWSILIYSPLAHWVWAPGGWLRELGALDFAGGTVVHIASGVSALVAALVIGHRTPTGERMEPHDVPMTVLGAGLLWGTMYVPYRKAYLSGMNPLSFVTIFTFGELGTTLALAALAAAEAQGLLFFSHERPAAPPVLADLPGYGGTLVTDIAVIASPPEVYLKVSQLAEAPWATLDHLAAMTAIWSMDKPAYDGKYVSFSGVDAHPRPVQQPTPPIVFGGHTAAAYRRAVMHGHGWYGFALDADRTAECIAGLRRAAER